MGIRIHKVLGYGLTDVEYDKEVWKLTDERFNPEGIMLVGDLGYVEPFRSKDWWGWLQKKHDRLLEEQGDAGSDLWCLRSDIAVMLSWKKTGDRKQVRRWTPPDSITFQPEFGDSKVLLLVPPNHSHGIFGSWSRHDDMIDYMEEGCGCEQGPRVELYRWSTLYPHCSCMNRKTGERMQGGHDFFRAVNAMLDGGVVKLGSGELNAIADRLGFENATDAYENLRPEVPGDLRLFCEWSKMFRDPMTVFDLLPMLYVYWC